MSNVQRGYLKQSHNVFYGAALISISNMIWIGFSESLLLGLLYGLLLMKFFFGVSAVIFDQKQDFSENKTMIFWAIIGMSKLFVLAFFLWVASKTNGDQLYLFLVGPLVFMVSLSIGLVNIKQKLSLESL